MIERDEAIEILDGAVSLHGIGAYEYWNGVCGEDDTIILHDYNQGVSISGFLSDARTQRFLRRCKEILA